MKTPMPKPNTVAVGSDRPEFQHGVAFALMAAVMIICLPLIVSHSKESQVATTLQQDQKFIDEVINIPDDLLEKSIDWISDNLSPEEVFSEKQLNEWAERNGFVEGDN